MKEVRKKAAKISSSLHEFSERITQINDWKVRVHAIGKRLFDLKPSRITDY
jgi:hypothetical protein